MLWDCGLNDIELSNDRFTYSNRRRGAEETKPRIDRALANREWLREWPRSVLNSFFANTSDHKPIKLCLDDYRQRGMAQQRKARQASFKFEPLWPR